MEFPFVRQYLGNGDRKSGWHIEPERFFAAVAKCETAREAGRILNPDFKAAKETINRVIHDAWTAAIAARYTHSGKWESLPKEVYEFSWQLGHPELHTAKGKLAKVTHTKLQHPMIKDMRDFLTDIAPLADLIEALKPLVKSAREPKSADEKKPGYRPPAVATEAEKLVLAVLEQVTQATYDDLLNMIFETHKRWLSAFLSFQKLSNGHGYAVSPREWMPGPAPQVVEKAIEPSGKRLPNGVGVWHGDADVWKRRSNCEEQLMEAAREQADEIRTYFVTKNLAKIASIVEAKGNLKDASQISRTVDLRGLTGVLRFTFKDGSRFDVQNQVVWVVNSYGTHFNRFPLTFHNPVLPDGSKMPRPSQERMNAVFTKAAR